MHIIMCICKLLILFVYNVVRLTDEKTCRSDGRRKHKISFGEKTGFPEHTVAVADARYSLCIDGRRKTDRDRSRTAVTARASFGHWSPVVQGSGARGVVRRRLTRRDPIKRIQHIVTEATARKSYARILLLLLF